MSGCVSLRLLHVARPLAASLMHVGDAQVEMRVNKLWSTRTQLPFDYYALPFCKPDKVVMAGENLGEVLSGDRIGSSAYKVRHCTARCIGGVCLTMCAACSCT